MTTSANDATKLAEIAQCLRDAGTAFDTWFAPSQPVTFAESPGRLDVMGGIADYSGATVLEATIGATTGVAVQPRSDGQIRVVTLGAEAGALHRSTFEIPVATTRGSTEMLRAHFTTRSRWAAYVVGVWHILYTEGVARDLPGASVVINGAVPLGAGVASSAALEVATMRAVLAMSGLALDGVVLASYCQMVEQRVAGAPCGIMDQITSALGEAGSLLALQCQPHTILGSVALPTHTTVVGLDSGVKHSVGGTRYPRVRASAFMAREILARDLGLLPAGDHLCNLSPGAFAAVADRIPQRMVGETFLRRYGSHRDLATTVEPSTTYRPRGAALHAISEQARVMAFWHALRQASEEDRSQEDRRRALVRAGRHMYGSHRSYSRNCGLGAAETDAIVRAARIEGATHGIYGAKITGGGSGGTVALLCDADAQGNLSNDAVAAVERIRGYAEGRNGHIPRIITGTGAGAMHRTPLTSDWPPTAQ